MENVGQACNSNKRMIVMDDHLDDFVASLTKRAGALSPREPGDDSDDKYSPMVSRKAAEDLLAQVQDAVEKGATLHTGGTIVGNKGAYFAPAVLSGVTPRDASLQRRAVRSSCGRLQGQPRRRGG